MEHGEKGTGRRAQGTRKRSQNSGVRSQEKKLADCSRQWAEERIANFELRIGVRIQDPGGKKIKGVLPLWLLTTGSFDFTI
jgi:hypothetical protein